MNPSEARCIEIQEGLKPTEKDDPTVSRQPVLPRGLKGRTNAKINLSVRLFLNSQIL